MCPCNPRCQPPTPSQAHCGTCHCTFGGVTSFDRHRRNGVCLDPVALGLRKIKGIWREPATDDLQEIFRGSLGGA